MRVGLLSSDRFIGICKDNILLEKRYKEYGIDVSEVTWETEDTIKGYDRIIIRSTWGYQRNYKQYLKKLAKMSDSSILLNSYNREHPLKFGAVYHCFDGDITKVRSYYDIGVNYFGIGGKIFYEKELEEAVRFMSDENIVLETDAPYINLPGKTGPNTSISLWNVAEKIAAIRGTTTERIVDLTTRNAERLFSNLPYV